MSNTLEARLKSNLNIVLIIFVIASVFSIIRILSLTSSDEFHVNAIFTDKAYLPILIQGFGFLAIIVSSILYRSSNKLSEGHQVIAFSLLGAAFIPFTIILFIIGIMKFVEDNRYKMHFVISGIVGLLLFGLAFTIIFI